MNPKRFLARAVSAQDGKEDMKEAHLALREHIRKTLSRERLSEVLKERMVQQRRAQAIHTHLVQLEEELAAIQGTHSVRVRQLQERIELLKKKV